MQHQAHLREDAGKGVQLRQLSLKGVGGLEASAIAALELPQSQGTLVVPVPMLCSPQLPDADSAQLGHANLACKRVEAVKPARLPGANLHDNQQQQRQ